MGNDKIILQIILDKDGQILNKNEYTIQKLNEKIIPTSILKSTVFERQHQSYSFNIKDEHIQNELWRKYPNWDYTNKTRKRKQYKAINLIEISNLGRVKINNMLMPQEDKKGYIGYLQIKDYPALGMVWNLVAETWLKAPEDGTIDIYHVHHISNNGYDNSIYNLIWLDKETHAQIDHKIRV